MRRGLTPASGRGSALGGGRRELVRTEPRVCLPHIPGSKARLSIQEFFCTMQCAHLRPRGAHARARIDYWCVFLIDPYHLKSPPTLNEILQRAQPMDMMMCPLTQ
jgi:hypothetical protein